MKRLVGYPRYWVLCQLAEAQQSGSSTAHSTSSSQPFHSNKGVVIWSHSLVSVCKQNTLQRENLVVIFPHDFGGHSISLLSKGTRRNFSVRSRTSFKHLCEKHLSEDLVVPAAPCWEEPEPICLGINGKESLGQLTASKF